MILMHCRPASVGVLFSFNPRHFLTIFTFDAPHCKYSDLINSLNESVKILIRNHTTFQHPKRLTSPLGMFLQHLRFQRDSGILGSRFRSSLRVLYHSRGHSYLRGQPHQGYLMYCTCGTAGVRCPWRFDRTPCFRCSDVHAFSRSGLHQI